MKIKIKNSVGGEKEIECEPSMTLRTLLDKYKDFVKKDGKIIRKITFIFGGDAFIEEDMDETLEKLGIEDGNQIVSNVLYNGGNFI